jgi:hypothetical protein
MSSYNPTSAQGGYSPAVVEYAFLCATLGSFLFLLSLNLWCLRFDFASTGERAVNYIMTEVRGIIKIDRQIAYLCPLLLEDEEVGGAVSKSAEGVRIVLIVDLRFEQGVTRHHTTAQSELPLSSAVANARLESRNMPSG